jgi:hypothetical protein
MPDLLALNHKPDWQEIGEPGDYAFTEALGLQVLVMRCPFCNSESPYPPLAKKILKNNPLTIEGSIFCSQCDVNFVVQDGVAFRAGLTLEILKEEL